MERPNHAPVHGAPNSTQPPVRTSTISRSEVLCVFRGMKYSAALCGSEAARLCDLPGNYSYYFSEILGTAALGEAAAAAASLGRARGASSGSAARGFDGAAAGSRNPAAVEGGARSHGQSIQLKPTTGGCRGRWYHFDPGLFFRQHRAPRHWGRPRCRRQQEPHHGREERGPVARV
jgi:hypothetical protein